ncbi:hypothetical protein GA0061102_10732 [Rhizobium miluonense]|uniref:Uncharacterized protein n=1 Tax=Rhizobium miluonense TaxID=411945 RepID=A0A1C3XAK8_9HYPH|nr:hypothetical protein GA0061102_10732 [Rhizobium miluonense]
MIAAARCASSVSFPTFSLAKISSKACWQISRSFEVNGSSCLLTTFPNEQLLWCVALEGILTAALFVGTLANALKHDEGMARRPSSTPSLFNIIPIYVNFDARNGYLKYRELQSKPRDFLQNSVATLPNALASQRSTSTILIASPDGSWPSLSVSAKGDYFARGQDLPSPLPFYLVIEVEPALGGLH